MNREQATEFVLALGGKIGSITDEWVRSPCLLAPWRHKSGKDSNPSFGVSISKDQKSRFHCFTCQSGALATLLQTIELHALESPGSFHGDMAKARSILEAEEVELPVLSGYTDTLQTDAKIFQALPEYWLDTFQPAPAIPRAMKYLEYRGFGLEDALKWDIRYDIKDDRLMFPYRDVFGQLAGIRGRAIQLPGEPDPFSPHHDYVWNKINNSSMVWLNEQALDVHNVEAVIVVEGQFDVVRVGRVYPHVLGNLTAKPVMEKMHKLLHARGVILMLDGDQPGRDATQKYIDFLKYHHVPVCPIYLPMDAGKTDPDKLGEDWIRNALTEIGLPT